MQKQLEVTDKCLPADVLFHRSRAVAVTSFTTANLWASTTSTGPVQLNSLIPILRTKSPGLSPLLLSGESNGSGATSGARVRAEAVSR